MATPYFAYGTTQAGFVHQRALALGEPLGRFRTVAPHGIVVAREAACSNPGCRYKHRMAALVAGMTGLHAQGDVFLVDAFDALDALELAGPYVRAPLAVVSLDGTQELVAQAYPAREPERWAELVSAGGGGPPPPPPRPGTTRRMTWDDRRSGGWRARRARRSRAGARYSWHVNPTSLDHRNHPGHPRAARRRARPHAHPHGARPPRAVRPHQRLQRHGGVAEWRARMTHEAIALRAYFLALEERGGDPLAHWLTAERELTAA
jgi:hypothetical protein